MPHAAARSASVVRPSKPASEVDRQQATGGEWTTRSRLMRHLQAGDAQPPQGPSAQGRGQPMEMSQPGDASEQEADRVAEQIAAPMPAGAAPPVQIGIGEPRTKGALMRKCTSCSEEEKGQAQSADGKRLQRSAEAGGGVPQAGAPPIVDRALRSGGAPIQPSIRTDLKGRFGQDLGDVRVHTGGDATASARAVGAKAYTVGTDIVLRDPHVDAATPEGRKLLAHELTHVVQQRGDSPVLARDDDAEPAVDTGNSDADVAGADVAHSDASDAGSADADAQQDATSTSSAPRAPEGAPPEVQQFLDAEFQQDPVAGVGDQAAAFRVLDPLTMAQILDMLVWLGRAGYAITDVSSAANQQRLLPAVDAVRLQGEAAPQPEDMALLRERLALLDAGEQADVIRFFPAAAAPPEVMVSDADATPPPNSPYATWPPQLLRLVVRSYMQRNAGAAGSRQNVANGFWGGDRPTSVWDSLDRIADQDRSTLLANYQRAAALGFPWDQVDSLGNIWTGTSAGLSFNAGDAGAIRAALAASTSFCHDSWLSGSEHPDGECWRETVVTPSRAPY
jgi:Domain of unknown function (DUF4157)